MSELPPEHAKAGGMIEGDAAETTRTPAADLFQPKFVTPTLWQRVSPFTHEALLALLLVTFLIVVRQIDPSFMSIRPQRGLYQQIWDTALLALPMTFIIITGGIDLSVGSIVALSSVALGIAVSSWGWPFWTGMIVAMTVGAACGALNGVFITKVKVHPLIVTLATMSAFRGLAEGISLPNTYSTNFPDWLTRFAKSPLRWDLWHGFLPYPSGFILPRELRTPSPSILFYGFEITGWIFILLAIISLIVLWKTRFGRTLYAIGFNETAARFSGLKVDRVKLAIYTFAGVVSGIVAINITAGQNTAKADVGVSKELEVITAVVLGGTSIFGGRGRIIGTLLGVALIHEVSQFVSWHYHEDELVSVVLGLLLITSVAVNALLTRKGSRS
jgi:rhamnose transport system permease protein